MSWRNIGPNRGGRSITSAGSPSRPNQRADWRSESRRHSHSHCSRPGPGPSCKKSFSCDRGKPHNGWAHSNRGRAVPDAQSKRSGSTEFSDQAEQSSICASPECRKRRRQADRRGLRCAKGAVGRARQTSRHIEPGGECRRRKIQRHLQPAI